MGCCESFIVSKKCASMRKVYSREFNFDIGDIENIEETNTDELQSYWVSQQLNIQITDINKNSNINNVIKTLGI